MDLPRQSAAPELDATARRVDDMVWIPGGTFRMDRDRGDGRLAGSVRAFVSGFWMDRAPVTVRQFGEFVVATGYPGGRAALRQPLNEQPVVYVTCQDAEAYADWIHKELPTAAEWECAAQGAFGLCGMIDGIWEWTVDWAVQGMAFEPCRMAGRPSDDLNEEPPDRFGPTRLLKRAPLLSCSARTSARPIDAAESDIGFRCVAGAKRRPI